MSAARAGNHPRDAVHERFVIASLAYAVLGGFSLAVSLPIEVIVGSVDASWVAHAQVHGHMQVIGFAGLFIVGMAFRLAPRFGGRSSMAVPWAETPVFVLLVIGPLARALGQPLAELPAFAAVAGLGAAAELVGAVLFAAMLTRTLGAAVRRLEPPAILLTAAGFGLVAQAVLGAWWVGETALDGHTLVATPENRVLLHLQLFGFLLPAILGVGMRSFPTFFGRKPPGVRAGNAVAATWLVGVLLWTGAETAGATSGGRPWLLAGTGQALVGGAILLAIVSFGPWRKASRLAAASKGLAWAIHPAVLWLAVSGVLLVGTAAQALVGGSTVSPITLDAVRHVFLVGVVTLAIVGMAQLILPEFASERLVRHPGAWRGPFFGAAISLVALLRGVLPLAGLGGMDRWWAMAVAGSLGWTAVGVFAVLLWRASRAHRAYLQRIERFRSNELPVR
ncbi:MAG: hypothetical protein AB7F65_02360 [Dehalococcoidia bacterium]